MGRSTSSPYVPLFVLAKGGMAEVEVVARIEGGFCRRFARKRPLPHLVGDPKYREMFMREAAVAGAIRHPNVVGVVDVGTDERGPYLVMEFVEGPSLANLLTLTFRSGAVVPLEVALRVGADIARGLDAVHRAVDASGNDLGLVHRDLSPQNVLLSWAGHAAIADFGVAKARAHHDRTTTGVVKGKLGYLAPELLRLVPPSPKGDMFALGIILYETLTGRRLYPASEPERTFDRILNEEPPDLRDIREVPDDVAELVSALLAKDPAARPTAMEAGARIDASLRALGGGTESNADFMERVAGSVREEEQTRLHRRTRLASESGTVAVCELDAEPVVAAATPTAALARRRLGARGAVLALALASGIALALAYPAASGGALAPATKSPSPSAAAAPPTAQAPAASMDPGETRGAEVAEPTSVEPVGEGVGLREPGSREPIAPRAKQSEATAQRDRAAAEGAPRERTRPRLRSSMLALAGWDE